MPATHPNGPGLNARLIRLDRMTQASEAAQSATDSTESLSDILNALPNNDHPDASATRVETLAAAVAAALQRFESLPDAECESALRQLDQALMDSFKPTAEIFRNENGNVKRFRTGQSK